MKIELDDSAGKQVYLNLSARPDSVTARDRSGLELGTVMQESGNGTLIYVTVPDDYVEIEIDSSSFTGKNGSLWDFYLGIGASEESGPFTASLSLPAGAVLKTTNGAVQGSGDSLLITWSAEGMNESQKANLRAGYEMKEAGNGDTSGLTILGILAAIAVVAGAYLLGIRRAPQNYQAPANDRKLEAHPVFLTLDETDREIIREIRQKGKTTQAKIYMDTHIPKATLSRRLASLEGRGIIKKSQKGSRNLVTITDIFEK
ncbi:MAG: winged helix-turn-helix transcriptional regulator [Candidatus Micrarchaeota archaeon]